MQNTELLPKMFSQSVCLEDYICDFCEKVWQGVTSSHQDGARRMTNVQCETPDVTWRWSGHCQFNIKKKKKLKTHTSL